MLLPDNEVHVWTARMDVRSEVRAALRVTLDCDENERAERFAFARDRDRFIVRRGVLRQILAAYLGAEPGHLRFSHGKYGKPALDGVAMSDPLRFNVSRSRDLAVVAVARSRELGVDVEYLDADRADEQVAQRYFARRELVDLNALSGRAWLRGFFDCWTRKEAYLKARGEGLSFPLDAFEVSLSPGDPPALVRSRAGPAEADRWTMRTLDYGDDWAACLIAEGHSWSHVSRQWNLAD